MNIVGAMKEDLWEATKARIAEALEHRSWVERGKRYASDVAELVQEVERLRAIVRETTANVSAVQAVSTRQENELRALRAHIGTPAGAFHESFWDVAIGILGEAWSASCKWGTPEQLVTRPDGTGGPQEVKWMDAAQDVCEIAMTNGTLTWKDVLEEETAEVAAARSSDNLKTELRQVVATGLRWLRSIQLREKSEKKDAAETSSSLTSHA